MRLNNLPRARLANLPTPLQECPQLSKALKGPRIFIKRDDMTGLALGGNKTRKLEYLMGEALHHKADTIVTGAAFHSNWCTQAAAAARRLGMNCALIKKAPEDGYDPAEYDGNHLLHFLMGAEIKTVLPENFLTAQQEKMEELRSVGRRPFLLTDTGSTPPGVAGYVGCMLELAAQAHEIGLPLHYLVHTTGSGGTQAGLVIGAKAFHPGMKVIGATTGSTPEGEQRERVSQLIEQSLKFLEFDTRVRSEEIIAYDQYAGAGYGFMTQGKADAIQLVAETEGIFLDPVYTATSMALLIDLCRRKFFKKDDVVVFLHTGGAAALFPYRIPLKAYAQGETPPWTVPPWAALS